MWCKYNFSNGELTAFRVSFWSFTNPVRGNSRNFFNFSARSKWALAVASIALGICDKDSEKEPCSTEPNVCCDNFNSFSPYSSSIWALWECGRAVNGPLEFIIRGLGAFHCKCKSHLVSYIRRSSSQVCLELRSLSAITSIPESSAPCSRDQEVQLGKWSRLQICWLVTLPKSC